MQAFSSVFFVVIFFLAFALLIYRIYINRREKFIITLGQPQKVFYVRGKYYLRSNNVYPITIKFFAEHVAVLGKNKKYFHYDYASCFNSTNNWFELGWSTNLGIERIYFQSEQATEIQDLLNKKCSLIKIRI